jgi:hypothetical protein
MKQIRISLLIISLASLVSCTKNFEETNTDPNRISQISPGTLLNPILYSVTAFNMEKADDFTFNLMQVALPYPSVAGGVHRYDIQENAGASTWNTYYRWLTNILEMHKAAVTAEDVNYQAIALTLKAWILSNTTDCFGDIPMDEAGRGEEGIFRPAFNTQQEVYTRILSDLELANTLYNPSKAMNFGTDILMGNNISRWKKFTNSLRMRLLLRVSAKPEMNSLAQLRTMIADPTTYPVFTKNEEAAILTLSGVTPFLSPWGRAVDFTTFRAAGKFFTDELNAMNDPRREKFCTQARNPAGNTTIGYEGIPSGFDGSESQFDYIPSNVNIALVTAPMICPILPYSEVEFIKAEVALLSDDLTTAKTSYEKGVKSSIEQWGATLPANYFENTETVFDGTLERIHRQKYFSLYFVDFQQWFEHRRTGFPVLPKGAGMVNDQKMPVRYYYPIAIRSTNTENYNKAVERMGGDNINSKGWWEK